MNSIKYIINNGDAHYKQRYYSVISKNNSIRLKSSSGGAFSELARIVIEKNGVVYGAIYDHGVVHYRAKNYEELEKIRGSKYVQSNLIGIYDNAKNDLESGTFVLFSGTPCQISGLKSFLGKTYTNLFLVDVICHGTPSPLIWSEYVLWLENKYKSKVKNVRFRSKRIGWRCQGTEVYLENGKVIFHDLFHDFFSRGFLRNYTLRPSCHQCSYASLNRPGDITLGDFWGYKDEHNKELDDDKGISLVLINSKKGAELFEQSKEFLEYQEKTLDDFFPYQSSLREPFPPNVDRDNFWRDYYLYGFEYVRKKYLYSDKHPWIQRFKISKFGRRLIYLKKDLTKIWS